MRKAGILEDPYEGDQPYIFISYSHIDQPEVIKIIRLLQEMRYRVWYDAGIDPGTEWDENIAEHIEQCAFFLAMISTNYINSLNCKDEIKYARDLGKSQILVYLEETQLPGAMRMRMGRLQAVYKSGYDSEEAFIRKLLEAKGIEQCYEKEDEILKWMREEFHLEELINNLTDTEESEDDLHEDDWKPVCSALKLETEDGTYSIEVRCTILDWVEYDQNRYLILIPEDEESEERMEMESGDDVFIVRAEKNDRGQYRYFMFENDETANAVFELFKNKNNGFCFVDFDQDTCVRRIADKTPELDEKDDSDIEDDWYDEDEDYGRGLRGKIQNLISRADEEFLVMILEVIPVALAVMIGFWAYGEVLAFMFGVWVYGKVVFWNIRETGMTVFWVGCIIFMAALFLFWFDVGNIQDVLPLVKNKEIGWRRTLGLVVWSLAIIAMVTIAEMIICPIVLR